MAKEMIIRQELTTNAVNKLFEVLEQAGYEPVRTKDLQTITFMVGEVNSDSNKYSAYGSIKFTLHKSDFDIDDAQDEYEDTVAMKAKKAADKEKKKKETEKKKARTAAKKAEKEKLKEAVKEEIKKELEETNEEEFDEIVEETNEEELDEIVEETNEDIENS